MCQGRHKQVSEGNVVFSDKRGFCKAVQFFSGPAVNAGATYCDTALFFVGTPEPQILPDTHMQKQKTNTYTHITSLTFSLT